MERVYKPFVIVSKNEASNLRHQNIVDDVDDDLVAGLDVSLDDLGVGIRSADEDCAHLRVDAKVRARLGQERSATTNLCRKKLLADDVRQQNLLELFLVFGLEQVLDDLRRDIMKRVVRRRKDGCIFEALNCLDKTRSFEKRDQCRQRRRTNGNLDGVFHFVYLSMKYMFFVNQKNTRSKSVLRREFHSRLP